MSPISFKRVEGTMYGRCIISTHTLIELQEYFYKKFRRRIYGLLLRIYEINQMGFVSVYPY